MLASALKGATVIHVCQSIKAAVSCCTALMCQRKLLWLVENYVLFLVLPDITYLCVLCVCHLWGGNKVNLLCEAVYGISFTDKTWTFSFSSYLLYSGVTKCCIYCSFLVFLQIQSGIYFSIFTVDVTVFHSVIFWFNGMHILAHVLEAVNKWIGITGTFTVSFNCCILAAI